ncbi:MAG: DUF2333 family protein [Thiotrichaceae bacterium]|nr:DUF2333 family protein [Thiotrichaceae bacterium]
METKKKISIKSKEFVGLYHPKTWKEKGLKWTLGLFVATYIVVVLFLGFFWSAEPSSFDVMENAQSLTKENEIRRVTGSVTTATFHRLASTILDKPGGYLTNDIAPPGLYLDNIPNWEFGVLVNVRDLSISLRDDFSRSQSQSSEDKDLVVVSPRLHFDSDSWIMPSSESQYKLGIKHLEKYLIRLSENNELGAQFFTRADNLQEWLRLVEKRLGSFSQRLSASAGQYRENTDLAGDAEAKQSTDTPSKISVKTKWADVDDVFYETRGYVWALLHELKAVEVDFKDVLVKKNALASLRQIIRELESTQQTVWSPVILSGSGFGFVTNHSLVMASYISRANAALIDFRTLLTKG